MSTADYWIGLPVLPAMREGPPHLVEVTVTQRHQTIIEEGDLWESMAPDFVAPLRPTISVLLPIEEDHYPSFTVTDDAGTTTKIHVDQPCCSAQEVVVGGRYLAIHEADEEESISLVSASTDRLGSRTAWSSRTSEVSERYRNTYLRPPNGECLENVTTIEFQKREPVRS